MKVLIMNLLEYIYHHMIILKMENNENGYIKWIRGLVYKQVLETQVSKWI